MLILIWLFGMTLAVVSCELTGENICEIEERYPVNITEFSLKNVTVRNYQWCMGFPPRCSFYTVKTLKVPEVVERHQIRLVRKCCPGFAENSQRDACVPCKKCYEGTCGNDGKCLCNSGFRGEHCDDACEPMRWGVDCQHQCLCERGACNPRTGKCDCPTGWFGPRCEVPCLEGFYGKHCISRCRCGERDRCSPETGECLTKSPHQQDHHTTRAIHYMTEDILNLTISLNKQRTTPSLKKYYTFDMELGSSNNTAEENEITNRSRNNGFTIPRNKSTAKSFGNTMKSAEESVESTTEMSSEIIRRIENVAILGENGSLENRDEISSEEKSQEIVDEKFESNENLHNNPKIPRNRTDSKVTNSSQESPNEINVSNGKHKKGYQESNNRYQKDLKTNQFHISVSKAHHFQTEKHQVSPETPRSISASRTTTPKITSEPKSSEVTISEVEKIISPTSFKTDTITTPFPKSNGILNSSNIEEDELQNIDIVNNLITIRETTTQSSSISTTIGYMTLVEKGLLPFDVLPSTKSIDLRNDLHTTESTENQVLMRAYERRNFNEQIGEGASEEFDNSTNKSSITTHMVMVALVSFILVLILSGMIMAHHYTRKKKRKATTMKIDNQNFGGHSVSVYTHSIFHTPLPDPPVFENPVFKTPANTSSDHRTIQTHVIYSLNIPENKINDGKEYTYDHPPSTGSYRAASIPEPPEVFESVTSEPVYDEIPSNRRGNRTLSPPPSYKSSCLYMNTCGKTRF